MLLDKLSESDDIIQEKYITVTVFKTVLMKQDLLSHVLLQSSPLYLQD